AGTRRRRSSSRAASRPSARRARRWRARPAPGRARDRELAGEEYFGSEELLNLQKQHAVVLQRFWRGYLARRRA
ncbi:unnamed protein product, partial [Heterosigma akashiwo]